MFKSFLIVRVRKVDKHNDYYSTKFMYYKDYASEVKTIIYGETFELYPYKWYDLRWIYQKSFFFLSERIEYNATNTPAEKPKHIKAIISNGWWKIIIPIIVGIIILIIQNRWLEN